MLQLLRHNLPEDIIAFSTKRGGNKSNYDSFNITHYCGDSDEHVTESRVELCQNLGISDNDLIVPHQTHSTNIISIDKEFFLLSNEERQQKLYNIDVILTNLKGICIGVSTADCIPILLFDKENKVVVAIHAGWRGTVQRIVDKTIKYLKENYFTNPQNICAVICPGISEEAFEVGEEVYDTFYNSGFDMNKISKRYNKCHINLKEANRIELLNCGVNPENIQDCTICTYSNFKDYFSARRLGVNSGRIFNGIMIRR
ncbi:MAG: peptidoglycan editing factor PgeF [Bacteroidales bacterium]|nr:peptidoglycan editing factor PgeF [Bacteroidales bacterium]